MTRVAVLAVSMGGGAAGEAGVRAAHGEIDRVISLSPVPITDPEHLRGPMLFVASEEEPMVAQPHDSCVASKARAITWRPVEAGVGYGKSSAC